MVGIVAAPLGLFRRREKDEWLGELADIRHEALGPHGGGLDHADAPMPPRDGAVDETPGGGDAPAGPVPAPSSTDEEPHPAAAPGVRSDPPPAAPASTTAPPPAAVDPADPAHLATPAEPVGAGDGAPADRRPEPHRQRPGELWHPALDLTLAAPAEIQPEERIDPSELVEPDPDPAFTTRARPFIGGPGPVTHDPRTAPAGLDLGMAGPGGIAPDELDEAEPPAPDVLTARDLDDGPPGGPDPDDGRPVTPATGGGPAERPDLAGDSSEVLPGPERPRIRPPSEVFDGPPPPLPGVAPGLPTPTEARGTDPAGPGTVASAAGERSLVGEPVSRRLQSGASRRSLFGNPVTPAPDGPDVPADTGADDPPVPEPSTATALPGDGGSGSDPLTDGPEPGPPAVEGLEILTLRDDGTVALPEGTIRLAPGSRPEVSRLGGTVGLSLGSGWCWVASTATADPVLLTLPTAALLVPAGGHALAVVEGDGSVFVSVVRGTATLDRPGGTVSLPVGTIAQLRRDGTVHTDQATPEEMATDEILTRNLSLDVGHPPT